MKSPNLGVARNLYFDSRWNGRHGISRFAFEVRTRSSLIFQDFNSTLSPTSPLDAFNLNRILLPSNSVLFNPGFNAGPSRALQLTTIHDLIPMTGVNPKAGLHALYFNNILKPYIRKSGQVFTVSETSKAEIQNWLNDESILVHNIGNGISDVFIQGHSASTLRTGRTVLYIGNMRFHKNLITLLSAMRMLPLVQLRLIVPEAELAQVWQLLREKSIENQCTVETNLTDQELLNAYRASDLLAFPSTKEGFGLPVAESIATGTPVVYSNSCSSVVEIAKGFGVGVDDALSAPEWASAIEHQLSLGAHCMPDENWKNKYAWTNVATKLDGYLEAALETKTQNGARR